MAHFPPWYYITAVIEHRVVTFHWPVAVEQREYLWFYPEMCNAFNAFPFKFLIFLNFSFLFYNGRWWAAQSKPRSCKGVNSKKQSQNMRAGKWGGALRDDTKNGCVADHRAQGCNVKSVIPKIKHCKLKRLEKTWARVSSGMFSSNQLRIYVGKWRVGYNYLIQTRYKIFLFTFRQDEQHWCAVLSFEKSTSTPSNSKRGAREQASLFSLFPNPTLLR